MGTGAALIIAAIIGAVSTGIGAGVQAKRLGAAQDEARGLEEVQRAMVEEENRRSFLLRQQQQGFQQQQFEASRAGAVEDRRFRQSQQSSQLSQGQLQNTLNMINQSAQMRNNFRNLFS